MDWLSDQRLPRGGALLSPDTCTITANLPADRDRRDKQWPLPPPAANCMCVWPCHPGLRHGVSGPINPRKFIGGDANYNNTNNVLVPLKERNEKSAGGVMDQRIESAPQPVGVAGPWLTKPEARGLYKTVAITERAKLPHQSGRLQRP